MNTTKSRLAQYGSVPVTETDRADQPLSWIKAQNVELAGDESPPAACRDLPFMVLFVSHLVAIIYVGITFGSWYSAGEGVANMQENDHQSATPDESAARYLVYLVLPCSAVAALFTYVCVAIITPMFPEVTIMGSLVASLVLMIALFLSSIATGSIIFIIFMACLVYITMIYVRNVWRLIPFAAANLVTALKGLKSNSGMFLISILFSFISAFWVVYWMWVSNGVLTHQAVEQKSTDGELTVPWLSLFLLLVSLYWTSMVILNTLQTTVAGIIGTWCFDKTAVGCCSTAVIFSLFRSVTLSFGSICLGSLLEALVKALRILAGYAKNMSREEHNVCGAIFFCILECILHLFEDIIDYFNQWAYVFVGIYGCGYIDSGRKAMELFRARGWTAIITNDLVGYVLRFIVIAVSCLTGVAAVCIESWTSHGSDASFLFGEHENAAVIAFFIGFFLGIFVSSAMTNAVSGAVNTVIVCYADAPAMLEENHPDLTRKMALAWISVFPSCGVRVPPNLSTDFV